MEEQTERILRRMIESMELQLADTRQERDQARKELRATRQALEMQPPRMVIETKGEAQVLMEMATKQISELQAEVENLKGFVSESQLTNQRLREHGTTEAQHLKMELSLQERVREGLRQENALLRQELEMYKEQYTKEHKELGQAKVLLQRIGKGEPNRFTQEISFDPSEEDFYQLFDALLAYLAEYPPIT